MVPPRQKCRAESSPGTGKFNGKSEILLGQCLKEVQTDKEIHIATTFAVYPWRLSPANIIAACRGSLRRLEVDSLSLGQLHWSAANYAPIQVNVLKGAGF